MGTSGNSGTKGERIGQRGRLNGSILAAGLLVVAGVAMAAPAGAAPPPAPTTTTATATAKSDAQAAAGGGPHTVALPDADAHGPVFRIIAAYGGGILYSTGDNAVFALGVHGASKTVPQPLPLTATYGMAPVEIDGILYIADTRLWRTDGTVAGTRQVVEHPDLFTDMVAFRGKLFFVANFPRGGGLHAIYRSDGTAAGTARLPGLPAWFDVGDLTPAGSQLYFVGCEAGPAGSYALWVTDGTGAGTRRLTSTQAYSDDFAEIVPAAGRVYFTLQRELWQTDGTAAGTMAAFPAAAGTAGAAAARGAAGTSAALAASMAASVPSAASSSTASAPAAPQATPVERSSPWAIHGDPSDLFAFGDSLLFFAGTGRGRQRGLFRSDGTAAGTTLLGMVAPLQVRQAPRIPPAFTAPGGALLFAAHDDAHGTELWRTDGSVAGTALVLDIARGARSADPVGLVAARGLVFFAAGEPLHGTELWQSDGTAAGTRLVQDIQPGPGSSRPDSLTVAGDHLYWTADDGVHGRRLWALPLPTAGPTTTASRPPTRP